MRKLIAFGLLFVLAFTQLSNASISKKEDVFLFLDYEQSVKKETNKQEEKKSCKKKKKRSCCKKRKSCSKKKEVKKTEEKEAE